MGAGGNGNNVRAASSAVLFLSYCFLNCTVSAWQINKSLNQWEWEGNGNKARLNLGLGMEMGMNHREWEGIGWKKTFPLITSLQMTADMSNRFNTHHECHCCVVAVCSPSCASGLTCINTNLTMNINTCRCPTNQTEVACSMGLYAEIDSFT